MRRRLRVGARGRRRFAAGCGAALLLAGAAPAEPQDTPPFEQAGHLEIRPCWFETQELPAHLQVRCATFHVPERWGDPNGPRLRLPVAILGFGGTRDAEPQAFADAILVPGGGGPGGSVGLEPDRAALSLASSAFLVEGTGRDLVLVDQRGAGLSDPTLHCDESEAAYLTYLSNDLPTQEEAALWTRASRACARRLEASGLTPAHFDSASAARDLEALRRALGYAQWNLFGISYAANLALVYARAHPKAVRAMILESPLVPDAEVANDPLTFERALRGLLQRCAHDARCQRNFPEAAGALDRLLARLAEQPSPLVVAHPSTLARVDVLLTPARLLDTLSVALYSTEAAHRIPMALIAADRGSPDLLEDLVRNYVHTTLDPRFATGLLELIYCREFIPFGDLARLEREANAHPWRRHFVGSASISRAQCEAWDVAPVDPAHHATVAFEGPALLLAGELDPVIPMADVRRAASQLPRSRLLAFPATGHDASFAWWPCVDAILTGFVLHPQRHARAQPGDAACRARAAAGPFAAPLQREILPAP